MANKAPHQNGRLRAPAGGVRANGKFYRGGAMLPAHYRKLPAERATDPAAGINAASPNFGRFAMPHIITFQGLMSTISKVYRNPDEAIKNSRENALKMRRDCFVMECLEARQRGTALLNWHLEPEDKDSADQKELCDRLTKIIQDIPRFTEYRRNLLEALWFGRYAVQHKYRIDRRLGYRRVMIDNWLPVHGDKIVFRYDDGKAEYDEDQIGVRVIGHYSIGDIVAGDRRLEPTDYGLAYFFQPWERKMFAVHKHMIEDAAFEDMTTAGSIHGVGIRSRIYWTWFQMQETLAMLMEYIERTGMGFTIYWFPAGNTEGEEKMRQVAFERSESNVILMPRTPGDPAMDGYGIERIEPNPQGAESLKAIVHEFFGHRIKRYILGQTLTTESQPLGLGGGAADVQYDSLLAIVQYDAANLEETITKEVVDYLKECTFPAARDIQVRFKIDTESADSEKKLNAVKAGWEMGLKVKATDVYDMIGMSKPSEDDEVLINPSIAQQARLWEQQHGQGNQAMGANLPGDAQVGSVEDLFGPLVNMNGDGEQSAGESDVAGSEQQSVRYRRDGMPTAPAGEQHHVGETKIINGTTYRLNEQSRWERAGDDETGGDQATPSPADPSGQPPQPAAQPAGPSTQERQQFAAKQLGSIDKNVAGMFKAFHASPEFQKGGEYWTQHFAPEQAGAIHKQLAANIGKDFGGGKVVDLNDRIEGAIGFSSPAGAMVVVQPKEPGGKWRVSYTVMTGPVKRAMDGGEQPAGSPGEPGSEAATQNAEVSASSSPDNSETLQTQNPEATGQAAVSSSVDSPESSIASAPPTPPQVPSSWLKRQHDSIDQRVKEQQSNVTAMARRKDELLSTGDPTDKKLASETGRKLTAERARLRLMQTDLKDAKKHWMGAEDSERQVSQAKAKEKESAGNVGPAPIAEPAGRKFHEMTREEFSQHVPAEQHKQHLKDALARGERVPVNVLKDYPELILAAARQQDRKDKEPEKSAEPAAKHDAVKSEIAEPFRSLNDDDLQAALTSVGAIKAGKKQLSRDELEKVAATLAPADAPKAKPKPAVTSAPQSPQQQAQKRIADLIGTRSVDPSSKLSAGRAAPSMHNYGLLNKAVASGKIGDKEALSRVLDESRRLAGEGDSNNFENALKILDKPASGESKSEPAGTVGEAGKSEPKSESPAGEEKSAGESKDDIEKHLTDAGLQPHDRNQAALRRAVANGDIAEPKQLAGVLKTAAKLKSKGDLKADDHNHVKEAIRRHGERQANKIDLGAIVEERAAEAEVAPADLHESIKHVHALRSEHVKARESAKADIRKRMNLDAKRIGQLENSGKDYTHVKGFDDVTRSVAEEYPELGIENEQDVWDLLKEGSQRLPARHDDVIIEEALAFLKLNKGKGMSDSEREELEKIPFRKRVGLLLGYSGG